MSHTAPTQTPLTVYSVEEMAAFLDCTPETVEDLARQGLLAGVKAGRSWRFPAASAAASLDAMAAAAAAKRRAPKKPAAVAGAAGDKAAPGGTKRQPRRPLPTLVRVGP